MLPQVPTPLIGRRAELADVRAELADPTTTLLTLIGPVGAGKSRLAAAVVESLLADGPLAVCTVDLAVVGNALTDLEPAALTGGAPQPADQDEPCAGGCGRLPQPTGGLLVLDNCDSVQGWGPDRLGVKVAGLLAANPALRVLATSREPLGVYGERRVAVGPLPVPAEGLPAAELEQVPSVALFTQRARAAAPGFAITDANRDDVAEICRQLDGLPLALELAAARLRVFPPRALLLRLQERLDVLEGRSADTLSRHRTLRSALASCFDQLPVAEQVVLRRLSVLPADFGLEAAEAVVGPTGRPVDLLLESLLERSALGVAQARDGEPRFTLLRTVRRFAQEQLGDAGELPETYRRLAGHVRAVAESVADRRAGAGAEVVVPTGEQQAIAEGVRWLLLDGDLAAAVTVLDKLSPYWLQHGQGQQARRWVAAAVRACEEAGNRSVAAEAHRLAGVLAAALADPDGAVEELQRSVSLHRELGDDAGAAAALAQLGQVAARTGDTRRARRMLQEAVVLAGDVRATGALALVHLAAALAADGDTVTATHRATEAARIWAELGDRRELARTRSLLAGIAAARADHPQAAELARSALQVQWELLDRAGLPTTLEVVAELVSATGGAPNQAATLLGAAAALRDLTRTPPSPLERATVERTTRRLAGALGSAGLRQATAHGRRESLADVVTAALDCRAAQPGPAPAPAAGSGPLTPREREVADLITRGMTNRQIARQLGIAEWTAVNHVRHIMRKLECPSRIHVARWMADQRQ